MIFGGNWNNGTNDGLFYLNCNNDSSNANTNIGSRILYNALIIHIVWLVPCPLAKIERNGNRLVTKVKDYMRIKGKLHEKI